MHGRDFIFFAKSAHWRLRLSVTIAKETITLPLCKKPLQTKRFSCIVLHLTDVFQVLYTFFPYFWRCVYQGQTEGASWKTEHVDHGLDGDRADCAEYTLHEG